ncbi:MULTISPECIES: ATP-binding protein [Streptomyces violaceusniger group]|uniref:ATP-binding protein n=1 Tax=Streptomyces violaceusniger group TaxID=2839105 RepID=UPI000A3D00BE|nr:ATP-binding protein [Streptomyces rhizosphaericus]
MSKVVRNPEGRVRPPNAPWYTLYPRRAFSRFGGGVGRRWRAFRTNREASRSILPNRSWRGWRPTFGRLVRAYAYAGTALLALWLAAAIYDSVNGERTWFHTMQWSTWFTTATRVIGPFLAASFVLTLFLIYWYHKTKKPLVDKARSAPHDLVPTAGTLIDRIVGRRELSQVIAQTLRNRRTRRPYLLVGGVGVGKTAVLVELTHMLAQQAAVPVPIRLRDMDAEGDLDFEKMARRRLAEEADQGVLASGQFDKTWRQLRLDDKAVVIADGLEEALLDKDHRDDRDNIIRRAIDRAARQKLPLVIASRPHPPLEGTRAVIADLEPLSEEAALEYLVRDFSEVDERRLDWIVETANVSDSPSYLQIARLLQERGLLEHMTLREESDRLDTRSHDCATLRLWLLDTYRRAVEDGLLFDDLVMDRQERQETIRVISALACLGLVRDSLEVTFDELVETCTEDEDGRREPRDGRLPVSERQRAAIWKALVNEFDHTAHWLEPAEHPNACKTEFSRFANNGQMLGLVMAHENKVRFPHSIIQAYLGYRLLYRMDDDQIRQVIEPALHSPGPARELLIALVLLSRHRAATGRAQPAAAPRPAPGHTPAHTHAHAHAHTNEREKLSSILREAAKGRQDPKYFDLYSAALDIDSVDPESEQTEIADELLSAWPGLTIRGDQRTVEEAKLKLVHHFGAALREVDRRRSGRRRSDRRSTQPPEASRRLPYSQFFDIGTHEPSHPVRIAITQEISSGGDTAFSALRKHFPLGTDPVLQYLRKTRQAKRKLNDDYTEWLESGDHELISPGEARRREQEHARFVADYENDRARWWRHFALRAWLLPMMVGSVSEKYRDEAKERLEIWLQHLAPATRLRSPVMPHAPHTAPDLPLSLENALARGFKNAANRRRRHPDVCDETLAYLVKQAEKMLTRSRCWYAQLTLLHALCLWSLPDAIGRPPGPDTTERHRQGQARTASTDQVPDGDTGSPIQGADPVRSVARWLSTAGTAFDTPTPTSAHPGHQADRLLHPFVAEAGDLVTLALETGHPERFLWIDENRAIYNVGSSPADPERYRKHNLWIAPSVGWSTLHPRAQRLVADVLVMLNLTERNGNPDEIEERLRRATKDTLPPCLTHDRSPLHPEHSIGRADGNEPGATCLPTCHFRLCPYPPKGGRTQTEMEEPFCRQQQALLHSRFRWRPPAVSRHTAPWVSIPIRELHGFWEQMANRNRKSTGQEPRVF